MEEKINLSKIWRFQTRNKREIKNTLVYTRGSDFLATKGETRSFGAGGLEVGVAVRVTASRTPSGTVGNEIIIMMKKGSLSLQKAAVIDGFHYLQKAALTKK